ncbi:MAG: helix-turn-helix domain-containing protein [Pikeienuella sp.]|uniref:helix-turn-helix domain-containing protein n=1 Tax=Pikeienuella sp. TaxID=2831957 RepID=UPI00391A873D
MPAKKEWKPLTPEQEHRRVRLNQWLEASGMRIGQAAEELGIERRTLNCYLSGLERRGEPLPVGWHIWLAACAIAHGVGRNEDLWMRRAVDEKAVLAEVPRVYRLALQAHAAGVTDWKPEDGFREVELVGQRPRLTVRKQRIDPELSLVKPEDVEPEREAPAEPEPGTTRRGQPRKMR